MSALDGWGNFYVIVGSSAGALIGLQFVVMTLLADAPAGRRDERAGGAFATPTIVHFGAVLFLSALASCPWDGLDVAAAVWGVLGACGLMYVGVVAWRMRTQTAYQPVFEDRLFHVAIPRISYAVVTASAVVAYSRPRPALFLMAGAALLLLAVGIHNTWDAVTFHVFSSRSADEEPGPKS